MVKIGLIGCPGTGKTTLAFKLSNSLDIPMILSKTFTKQILERDNYDYAPNKFVEHFLAQKDREFELVKGRIKAENESRGFITDRTTLEQFAYSLLNIESYSNDDIVELETICRDNMSNYTHLFYLPRVKQIRDNGIRTVNTFFQMKIDFIIRGIIDDWRISVQKLPNDIQEAVNIVTEVC